MKKLVLLALAVIITTVLCGACSPLTQVMMSRVGGSATDPANVVKNTRNTLHFFASAEVGLACSLGGYAELAAQQELLKGMQAGDAATSQEQLETLKNIHISASAEIDKKIANNAKIDAAQKKLAGKSMVQYAIGLVSTKKLVDSIQTLTKDPKAIASNPWAILYAATEVPVVFTKGVTSMGTLIKYLKANGVDTSEAQKVAVDLGT